ncbi:hypothetical protein Pfo_025772 [Paulownia fortunei]|nr:hypothetical protein Pfo_025772 [Paulownia fortunei]
MEVESSCKNSRRARKMIENRRRTWTLRAKEVLITSLKDLITTENSMLKAFPRNDIHADPHINSKIYIWKKNYGNLYSMLSRSMDSDEVWEKYVKMDVNARTIKFKSYPFYNSWCEIFGKDRAIGENAEDYNDDIEFMSICQSFASPSQPSVSPCQPSTSATLPTRSACQPFASASGNPTKCKKRKTIDSCEERIVDLMGNFCEQTNVRLGDLAKRIGYEFHASEKRTVVYEQLSNLGSLSLTEKIYVVKLLVNNSKDLDLFFSLLNEARLEMDQMILSGYI